MKSEIEIENENNIAKEEKKLEVKLIQEENSEGFQKKM